MMRLAFLRIRPTQTAYSGWEVCFIDHGKGAVGVYPVICCETEELRLDEHRWQCILQTDPNPCTLFGRAHSHTPWILVSCFVLPAVMTAISALDFWPAFRPLSWLATFPQRMDLAV